MPGKICKLLLIIFLGMVFTIGQEPIEARSRGGGLKSGVKSRTAGHIKKPAARVDSRWEQKADRNDNGYVDPHEADKAKKDYIKNRAKVDSKWENKADRNNDGYVDPHEAKKRKHKLMIQNSSTE